jgi:hypothetical protein
MSNTPDNVDTTKPARMVRKQVRITVEQNQQMKRIAATTGRSEADLLREAVAEKLAVLTAQQPTESDWRAKMRAALAGAPLDQDFEDSVRNAKTSQAAAWERRLSTTRRAMDQK